MRKSTFASLASLALSLSLALTGCQVGDEGDGGGGGGDPKPDAGGGNPGTPDAGGGNAGTPCPPSVEEFTTDVFDVAFKDFQCVGCHSNPGTGFNLTANDQAANLQAATNKAKVADGAKSLLVTKPTGTSTEPHGGGPKFAANSPQAQALEKFVGQVTGAAGACPP